MKNVNFPRLSGVAAVEAGLWGFYETYSIYRVDYVVTSAYRESLAVGCHLDSLLLVIRGREFLQCGLHAPDFSSVLGNGAITRELATSSDVVDHLLGPFLGVLV